MNMSDACRRGNLKMTFTSSSTVYEGLSVSPPMMEDMAVPVHFSNITGAFKRAGEHILWMYASEFGLDFRIIRPPRIYGPYYRTFRNPVHRMMEAAAAGESVTLSKVSGGSGGDFI